MSLNFIAIGFRAAWSYTGAQGGHHIVALGDHVVVPEDSPSFMLYVAGDDKPRPLLHIDKDVALLIKQHARNVLLSPERMGLQDFVPDPRYLSDAFWDGIILQWNDSARLHMGEA